jgi:hypothetical protein
VAARRITLQDMLSGKMVDIFWNSGSLIFIREFK